MLKCAASVRNIDFNSKRCYNNSRSIIITIIIIILLYQKEWTVIVIMDYTFVYYCLKIKKLTSSHFRLDGLGRVCCCRGPTVRVYYAHIIIHYYYYYFYVTVILCCSRISPMGYSQVPWPPHARISRGRKTETIAATYQNVRHQQFTPVRTNPSRNTRKRFHALHTRTRISYVRYHVSAFVQTNLLCNY